MSRLQVHSFPSVETLTKLWAFWVPTTLTQYTGCCIVQQLYQKVNVKDAESNYLLGSFKGQFYSSIWCISQILPPLHSLDQCDANIFRQWYHKDYSHRVSCSGQWSPLDGRLLVTAIIPKNNLTRICSTHHKIWMKLCKAGRHDFWLK